MDKETLSAQLRYRTNLAAERIRNTPLEVAKAETRRIHHNALVVNAEIKGCERASLDKIYYDRFRG